MTSLIERIEAAAGPCRELDAEIFRAIGSPLPTKFGPMGIDLEWDAEGINAVMAVGGMQVRFTPPAYTSSLDSVMTLVGVGLVGVGAFSTLETGSAGCFYAEVGTKNGVGKTPALALCAAALRARGVE